MNHIVFLLEKDKKNKTNTRKVKLSIENESYNVTSQLQFSIPIRIFFISGGYEDKLLDMTLKDKRLQGNVNSSTSLLLN